VGVREIRAAFGGPLEGLGGGPLSHSGLGAETRQWLSLWRGGACGERERDSGCGQGRKRKPLSRPT
jgi:hypothetical protein